MSNPLAKEERSKAKDIRQGIEDQRPSLGNKKKKKVNRPWKVLTKLLTSTKWYAIYSAATKEKAEAWVEKQFRSYAFLSVGSGVDRYLIKGPTDE